MKVDIKLPASFEGLVCGECFYVNRGLSGPYMKVPEEIQHINAVELGGFGGLMYFSAEQEVIPVKVKLVLQQD
jgi:hypothetical protein